MNKYLIKMLVIPFIIGFGVIMAIGAENTKSYNDSSNEHKRSEEKHVIKTTYISDMHKLNKSELLKYYISDKNSLVEMRIKLYYSMGKIHGYIVLLNSNNDYAVIDNVNMKITLIHDSINSGNLTYFYTASKNDFKKIKLVNGDQLIGFPIENIKYNTKFQKGIEISVKAECWHLSDETILYIND